MNNNQNYKNPKGAGRKQKFTEEELLKVIDHFLINEYKYDINASMLAEYANEKLGFEGVYYYHFNKKKAVKAKIEDIKKIRVRQSLPSELMYYQDSEIDAIAEKCYDDKVKLRSILLESRQREISMYKESVRLTKENRELKSRIKDNEKKYRELEQDNNSKKKENIILSKKVAKLQKLIDVDNQMKLLQYGWNLTNIDCKDLGEQYYAILKYCGIIDNLQYQEIESNSNKKNKANGNLYEYIRNGDYIKNHNDSSAFSRNDIPDVSIDLEELLNDE